LGLDAAAADQIEQLVVANSQLLVPIEQLRGLPANVA
jgi:hypothetical protein